VIVAPRRVGASASNCRPVEIERAFADEMRAGGGLIDGYWSVGVDA